MWTEEIHTFWESQVSDLGGHLVNVPTERVRTFPAIDFVVTAEPRFGARAIFEAPDKYRVEVRSGTLLLLVLFLKEGLAHSKVFSHLGDPSLELAESARLQHIYTSFDEFLEHHGADFQLREPRCPQRQQALVVLIRHSLMLILNHEIVHVLGGHVALKQSGTELTEEETLALEFDADCRAIGRLCSVAEFHTRKSPRRQQEFRSILGNMSIAAYWSQLMSGRLHQVQEDTHRFPMQRQSVFIAMFSTVLMLMNKDGFIDEGTFKGALEEVTMAIVHVEVARANISLEEPAAERALRFLEHYKEMKSVASRRGWKSVREKLLPYAFIPTPEGEDPGV